MRNIKPGTKKSKYKGMGLSVNVMFKNLAFVFFLALLGLVYIFNTHYAEKNLRKTQELETKIREAKWRYMTLKSDVMQQSTRSEIGRKLEGYEDLDDQKLPRKIEVSKS